MGHGPETAYDGRCHCGAIAYAAEIDPAKVSICHCTDCQALSGSAFRWVAATKENTFRLLSGQPKVYVKTGESGNPRAQAFCGACGSPIYSSAVGENAAVHFLRVGTVRQRSELKPSVQLWCRSSQGWTAELAAGEKTETQPVFDAKGGMR